MTAKAGWFRDLKGALKLFDDKEYEKERAARWEAELAYEAELRTRGYTDSPAGAAGCLRCGVVANDQRLHDRYCPARADQ